MKWRNEARKNALRKLVAIETLSNSQFCLKKDKNKYVILTFLLLGEPKNFLREIMGKIEASVF